MPTRPALGLALAALVALAATARSQGTDIFLAPLVEGAHGPLVGTAVNVTARAGYDNQPCFVDAHSFLYSASADTSGATDVFRFDLRSRTSARVTQTPESEYSPAPIPGGISCVRVEHDGRQRLWRFDPDGRNPRPIAADVDSVGYYAWRDEHTLVVFVVGEPHSLRIVDVVTGAETPVALDVGRSLHPIPGGDEISFLQRVSAGDEGWTIMRLDADTGATTPLAPALEGSQDCAWTPVGVLLMARDASIYALEGDGFSPVVSFGDPALASITRLAVDPTGAWIAIVASENP